MKLYAGGFSDTSTANEDIIPLIKVSENRETWTVFVLKGFSILPTTDCHIKINDGSSIFVPASPIGYSNEIRVEKLQIVDDAITYDIAFNY